MAQEDVRLSGTFLDSTGSALVSKTATLFSEGTTTPALATDTTDSAGEWDFTVTTPGRYDVQLVTGAETLRILGRDKFQVSEITTRNPTTAQPALSAYSTTSEASSLVATFGFRPATESSGVETGDAPSDGDLGYIDFTLSNDHASRQEWITARIAWEGSDVSDGSEDGQFNFWTMTAGTLVEELHLNGAALWPETDAGLDLGTSALGFNDLHLGSGGVVNFDGGDVTLTHSSNTLTVAGGTLAAAAITGTTGTFSGLITANGGITFAAGDDIAFTGGTGTNDIVLVNGLADALSITDGSADVIAISTAGSTNTVAITGDLTVSGTIAADTATVATTVTVTDNESTNEANAIIFTAGGDLDGGNLGLESDGTLNYNPSTGTLTTTVFVGALTGNVTGNASGTAATVTGGTQASITSTANLVTVGTIGTGVWQGTAIASGYIAADAITGAKIADDAIDSEHYTDGSIDNAHIADDAIDSEHYAAGSIDTAHIADNQITLAKMAGIARGKIIYGDASGDPAVLASGSANQVLTMTDGDDFDWATPTVGDITAVTAGVGLSGGGTAGALSIALDLSELSTVTPADGDFFSTLDSDGANEQKTTTTALATLFAGTSLTASSSVISVDDDFLKNDANDTTSGIVTAAGFTLADAANVSIGVPLLAGTDHTTTGITAQMLAGGAISAFDLVCIHSTTQEVVEADASAAATSRVIGIAPAAISDTATGTVLLQGFVRDDTWTWTTGGVLFLSETAGAMTHTAPTTDGAFVQAVGVALSPDVVYINPSIDVIEHA